MRWGIPLLNTINDSAFSDRRSLAKDPDQRFQTARDLKAALTWALEQPPPSTAAIRTPFNEWWGRFSPEAPPRWVAYQADDTAIPMPRPFRVRTPGGR